MPCVSRAHSERPTSPEEPTGPFYLWFGGKTQRCRPVTPRSPRRYRPSEEGDFDTSTFLRRARLSNIWLQPPADNHLCRPAIFPSGARSGSDRLKSISRFTSEISAFFTLHVQPVAALRYTPRQVFFYLIYNTVPLRWGPDWCGIRNQFLTHLRVAIRTPIRA